MNVGPWFLVDSETAGISAPVFVVDLAAQSMRRWKPAGSRVARLGHHLDTIYAK
jgi:DNA polymerase-3 subunit epsilon